MEIMPQVQPPPGTETSAGKKAGEPRFAVVLAQANDRAHSPPEPPPPPPPQTGRRGLEVAKNEPNARSQKPDQAPAPDSTTGNKSKQDKPVDKPAATDQVVTASPVPKDGGVGIDPLLPFTAQTVLSATSQLLAPATVVPVLLQPIPVVVQAATPQPTARSITVTAVALPVQLTAIPAPPIAPQVNPTPVGSVAPAAPVPGTIAPIQELIGPFLPPSAPDPTLVVSRQGPVIPQEIRDALGAIKVLASPVAPILNDQNGPPQNAAQAPLDPTKQLPATNVAVNTIQAAPATVEPAKPAQAQRLMPSEGTATPPATQQKPADPKAATVEPISGSVRGDAGAGLSGSESQSGHESESEKGSPNQQGPVMLAPSASAPHPNRAEAASPATTPLNEHQTLQVVRQVTDRMQLLAAARPREGVTIELNPVNLGTITLVVKSVGTQVDAQMYASHDQVRNALHQNQALLSQAMEQRGYHLGSVSVSSQVGDQPSGQPDQNAQAQGHSKPSQPTAEPVDQRSPRPETNFATTLADGVDISI